MPSYATEMLSTLSIGMATNTTTDTSAANAASSSVASIPSRRSMNSSAIPLTSTSKSMGYRATKPATSQRSMWPPSRCSLAERWCLKSAIYTALKLQNQPQVLIFE